MRSPRFLILVLAAVCLSPLLRADVYETNTTPCTTKRVMIKQYIFTDGYLGNCPAWEVPVAYGATLNITNVYTTWWDGVLHTFEIRYETQYSYHVAAPCPPASVSMVTASGWEFAPSLQNDTTNVFFNYGGETATIRAKSSNGNLITGGLQWHVTNVVTDVVTHDWVSQNEISLGSLSSGPAFLINVRLTGSSFGFQTRLDFAEGNLSYGVGGNPNKFRSDNSYPYGQERKASCSLGCIRNILAVKSKPVPTEDEIVAIMVANGKPESDFVNTGMGDDELAAKVNLVLNAQNLSAIRLNTTQTEVISKLNNGSVLIIATILTSNDRIGNIQVNANHVMVLRKVGDKYEVVDPATGKVKKHTLEEALRYMIWAGTPASTGRAWEIIVQP